MLALMPHGPAVSYPPAVWRQYTLPGLGLENLRDEGPLDRPVAANDGAAPGLRSYQVRCRTDLHDACRAAAARAGTPLSQMARSTLAMLTPEHLADLVDPGAPLPADGWRVGRRLETPVLRLRVQQGLTAVEIRKALGLMVGLRSGGHLILPRHGVRELEQRATRQTETVERLRKGMALLAFEPLESGVKTYAEALHVLRFPPGAKPDPETVGARFKAMAALLHPDAGLVDHHSHMIQLIEARRILRGK